MIFRDNFECEFFFFGKNSPNRMIHYITYKLNIYHHIPSYTIILVFDLTGFMVFHQTGYTPCVCFCTSSPSCSGVTRFDAHRSGRLSHIDVSTAYAAKASGFADSFQNVNVNNVRKPIRKRLVLLSGLSPYH